MPYLNQIIIMGHLGKDAETRTASGGLSVTTFSVATSYGKDNKKKTTWHNVVGFDLPQFVLDGLKKGNLVLVNGRQEHQEYTDKDGNRKFSPQVVASIVHIFTKGEPTEEINAPAGGDDLPF